MSQVLKTASGKADLPKPGGGWEFDVRPGGWVIASRETEDGTRERVRFRLTRSRAELWWARPGTEPVQARLAVKGSHEAGEEGGGDSDLVARFPGKVRKVLVSDGQEVSEGDRLVLVEAMKMEFAVKAPYAGTVKRLPFSDGDPIQPGDLFVELEAEETDA